MLSRLSAVILVALFSTGLAATMSSAGKNAGGAMTVHTNDSYNYSTQTVCTTASGDPGTCEAAVTRAMRDAGQVVWLLAAFPEESSPGVSVIYFGIDYDDTTLDPGVARRMCGPAGSLEVPDDDWPYGGRGNAIAFGTPIVGDLLFPFYVFKIDGGTDGSFFGTAINPTGGYAGFVDDNLSEPQTDLVTRFGVVRWFADGSNDCPDVVPGACCFDDGSCAVLMEVDCVGQNGAFQGLETVCEPNPCPYPQVCCNVQTQECRFLPPLRCQDLGEFWEVVNVDDAASCDGAPCELGACCRGDGICERRQHYSCARIGGTFQGAGTDCNPNPCPQPGACCDPIHGDCQFLLQTTCEAQGWDFQGPGTDCNPNPCPPPPTGACCIDVACLVCTPQACANYGGTYVGDGTDCDPNPCVGACCVPGSVCSLSTPDDCWTFGGTFHGLGTTCTPDPCDHACCKADGTCEMMTQGDCSSGGGTPLANQTCNDLPSPCADYYACCMLDGGCRIARENDCANDAGTFLHGIYCAPDDPCRALEPCCFPSGRCQILRPGDCLDQGGEVLPDSTCAPNPCLQPAPGACCMDDGICETLVEYLCSEIENSQFLGSGTECIPNPCPAPESCCFTDGTCEMLVPRLCQEQGGNPHGGVTCFPNPCPQPPTGACCLETACFESSQQVCASYGGTYLGDGTYCYPNPCPFDGFVRGDMNADGVLDIRDTYAAMIASRPYDPPCKDSADFDDSGSLDREDLTALLRFLFEGGAPPPPPFPDCGFDPTSDDIYCASFPPCSTQGATAHPGGPTVFDASGRNGARLTPRPRTNPRFLDVGLTATTTRDIAALQVTLSCDPAGLEFLEFAPSPAARSLHYISAAAGDATGRIALGAIADPAGRATIRAGTLDLGVARFRFLGRSDRPLPVVEVQRVLLVAADGTTTESGGGRRVLRETGEEWGDLRAPEYGLTVRNPIAPGSTIVLALERAAAVDLALYSVSGARIRTLFSGNLQAGAHEIIWNGRNDADQEAGAGLYYLRATTGGTQTTRPLLLLR